MLALLAVLAAAAAPAPAAGPPDAALGGISAQPLDPTGSPELRSYFHWLVRRGQRAVGVVLVRNGGSTAVHLRVYPVDAVTATTSGAAYPNGGVPLRRAGLWLTPQVGTMTVPAGASRTARFVARIPRQAAPGDHLAAIVFENADRPRTAHGAVAVIQVIRVAVAVLMRVAGPASPSVHATGIALRALPGTDVASTVVHLRNTGQLMCRPRLSVTLAGAGAPASTTTRDLNLILPGDAISYPLPWPRPLSAGTYTVAAAVTGCGAASSLRRALALDTSLNGDAVRARAVSPAAPGSHSPFPWWVLALVGAGGVLVGWLLSRRRRPAASAPGA